MMSLLCKTFTKGEGKTYQKVLMKKFVVQFVLKKEVFEILIPLHGINQENRPLTLRSESSEEFD
jgi:hypothetical protein